MESLPFQKPRKRIKDPRAVALYRNQHRRCEVCASNRSLQVHHIISRKMRGDDCEENLLVLDGGCHLEWHTWGGLGFLSRHDTMPDDVRAKIRRALRLETEE